MANMRITIHQPEHFPYMGFFQKVSASDHLVILDNVKFRKNYFQNRNKIKNKSGHDEWVTVAVEGGSDSKIIKDVVTSKDLVWRKKVLKKIQENLGFDASEIYVGDQLIDINMNSIRWAMSRLGIEKPITFASDINALGSKSELLANIVRELGGTTYVSGPSGREYLEISKFHGISVEFFEPKVENYYSSLYNLLVT